MAEENKVAIHIPEVLIVEILSLLPVKTLLQFKTVCKSWYATISSPYFVYKHLQDYNNNVGNSRNCFLAQFWVCNAKVQVFKVSLNQNPTRVNSFNQFLDKAPMNDSYICGPCDGIYYLQEKNFRRRALWNPAINEIKLLPPIVTPTFHIKYPTGYYEVYGIGLDPVTKDYKVIIVQHYGFCPPLVYIYSLKNDSWRYWGNLETCYAWFHSQNFYFVKGVFYCLAIAWPKDHVDSTGLLSFDLTTDAPKEIKLPVCLPYHFIPHVCLGVYQDSIALYIPRTDDSFHIWTLNQGTWTEKFNIRLNLQVQRMVGQWNEDKVLVESLSRFVSCDLHSQEISEITFEAEIGICCGVYAYEESLVRVVQRS